MRLPRKMEYQHRMLGTYHFINKGDAEMSLRRCRLLACAFPTQHSDKVVFVLPHHSLRPDATPARNARSPLRNMSLLHLFENGILCRFGARVNATMLPPKWLGWRRAFVSLHCLGPWLGSASSIPPTLMLINSVQSSHQYKLPRIPAKPPRTITMDVCLCNVA